MVDFSIEADGPMGDEAEFRGDHVAWQRLLAMLSECGFKIGRRGMGEGESDELFAIVSLQNGGVGQEA